MQPWRGQRGPWGQAGGPGPGTGVGAAPGGAGQGQRGLLVPPLP